MTLACKLCGAIIKDTESMNEQLLSSTKIISISHQSNVFGTINPIKNIIDKAKNMNIITLIDGAQAVPHLKVNLAELDSDFYVFSGHKMLGPTGVGVLIGRNELLEEMEPFLGGGEMINKVNMHESTWNEIPWKFEAGTPKVAQVIGLGAAIKYLMNNAMFTPINMDKESGAKKKYEFTMDILNNDLFPHCHNMTQKIYFLGYMANKLLRCSFQWINTDDRDSYLNKRIELTGTLLNNLFRNYFNKLVKEKQVKWQLLGLVIISSNAGGAWSPIGDVTTTMLWIGHQMTPLNIIKETFEVQSEDGILNLRPDKVNSISFSDANFVTYQGSFYKLITKTKNFSIIKSIVLIAVEPDYQVGIQDKPNLRYKNANKLYIQIGAKKTLIKVNKKYISQLFKDSKQGEIKKFFKSKKISIRDDADLKLLFDAFQDNLK